MTQPAPKQGSGLAVAGLVLGIIAAVTSFLPIINNLSAIIAFIGGILALIALIGALRGRHTAKGLSAAGVVLSVVSFAVVLITQSMYAAAIDSALEEVTSGSTPVAASDAAGAQDGEAASDEGAEASKTDYSNLAVGQSVQFDDGLSITVNSVQTGLTNYDDSPVVAVNVTYVNNGSSTVTFNPYDWKGEDANGAQYSTTYYSKAEDDLHSGKLSAGGSVTGNLYFEDGVVRVLYYSNMFNSEASAGWAL